MTLIKFSTTQISAFKTAFEAIDSLLSDVLFIFTDKDIRIKDVDKTGKLLISANFNSDKFDSYKYEHTSDKYKIGLSTDSIVKAIKTNLTYDVLTFEVNGTNGNEVSVTMTLVSHQRDEIKVCNLKKVNVITSPDNIASMEYSARCNINPTILSKYIKDLNHVAESIVIGITDENLVIAGIVDVKLDEKIIVTHNLKFGKIVTVDRDDSSKPSKKIPVQSLLLLTRCVNLSPECSIYLSNSLPLLVVFPLSSLGELKIVYL